MTNNRPGAGQPEAGRSPAGRPEAGRIFKPEIEWIPYKTNGKPQFQAILEAPLRDNDPAPQAGRPAKKKLPRGAPRPARAKKNDHAGPGRGLDDDFPEA